jgi:uncharacterized protein involved in exopolysaccharide biosynthesis
MNIATSVAKPAQDRPDAPWLHRLLRAIAQRWWLPVAGMVAALLLTLIWLNRTDYLYTAQLRVYAAPSTSGASKPTPLGGLASLAGLTTGAAEAVTPFRYYLDGLASPAIAERLAADKPLLQQMFPAEWDAKTGTWRRPSSLVGSLRRGFGALLGLPPLGWTPPGPERVQEYIATNVGVRQSVRTPLVALTYDSPDPVFAAAFLKRLHTETDAYVREQQITRTRANIAYLAERLQAVTITDQRAALLFQLTEQERQAMLTASDTAYAAEAFDDVTVSAEPTRPKVVPLLAGAALAGLLLGTVAAAWWGLRRRS